jgi:hypothetical protein
MSSEEQETLIRQMVDFTGANPDRARDLLQESGWDVPSAVDKFFQTLDRPPVESQIVPPARPVTSLASLLLSVVSSVQSCFGWAAYSLYRVAYSLVFGAGPVAEGEGEDLGCLKQDIDNLGINGMNLNILKINSNFSNLLTSNKKKITLFYLNTPANPRLREDIELLNDLSHFANNFKFYSINLDNSKSREILRIFRLSHNPPILVSFIPMNSTEIKLIGFIQNLNFNRENLQNLILKSQEESDRILAEEEQFKINRSLREQQDQEYQEALERDRQIEEARNRKEREDLEKENEKIRRIEEIEEIKSNYRNKFQNFNLPSIPCSIVVRLPNGIRVDRKFSNTDPLSIVYEWVTCAGLIHPQAASVNDLIIPKKFYLSTTFPSKRLVDMECTLEDLGLMPNAVLVFTSTADD